MCLLEVAVTRDGGLDVRLIVWTDISASPHSTGVCGLMLCFYDDRKLSRHRESVQYAVAVPPMSTIIAADNSPK